MLGVPVAIKDNVDYAGDITSLGTAAYGEPAKEDGYIVSRLREAGAIPIGKTNLPELAIYGFTESKTWGDHPQPLGPRADDRRLERRQRRRGRGRALRDRPRHRRRRLDPLPVRASAACSA